MEESAERYRTTVESLTYDGDELFGRDGRKFPPLPNPLTAKKWWWQHYYKSCTSIRERFYAIEQGVPEDYIIVSEKSCELPSDDDSIQPVRLPNHQMAIPMKWYFRLRRMNMYEQWLFIRNKTRVLPDRLLKCKTVKEAWVKAYENGMEKDFLACFYDLKQAEPEKFGEAEEEILHKIAMLNDTVERLERKIKFLRDNGAGTEDWPRVYERLYERYRCSESYDSVSFDRWCRSLGSFESNEARTVLKALNKPDSTAARISRLTRRRINAVKELRHKKNVELPNLYGFTLEV